MYLGREKVLEMRNEYLIPCVNYFYKDPPQIVRGDMQYLYDEHGKQYLDFFSGVSVMNCGHSNKYITDRVIEQIKTLQHVTNVYLTQPIVELAQRLAGVLPGDLHSSFFCMSGSEANEGAILLARLHTGKQEVISLERSLHGRTNLTMSATGIPMWRTDDTLYDGVYFIPNYTDADASIVALEKLLDERGCGICAFIAEAMQGNGGIIVPPDWYFKRVKELLDKHGVLLITDEVQTGFARTGKMFAIENFGVVPDIMTVAKALGNGFPIAAFCTTAEIAKSLSRPSASTLGGNPVSCAAALAVLDYIEEADLCNKAFDLGELLSNELNKLMKKHKIIKAVRGLGLMRGAELANENGEPLPQATDLVLEKLLQAGIVLGKNGLHRNVLAFQPPLIIDTDNISFLIGELDKALDFAEQ